MNVYLQELKMYRKSLITWTIALVVLVVLILSMFPAIAKDAQLLNKLLSAFPEGIQKALGLTTLDLSTVLGFYSFVFIYVLLVGSIQAMNLGTSILSAEVRERTADFLLVKPINRSRIITYKLLAALTNIAITNVVYILAAKLMMDIVKKAPYDTKAFFLVTFTLLFLQLYFIAFGIAVSVFFKKIRTVLPISLAAVFGFYIIYLLNQTLHDAKLSYVTPFAYFEPAYIVSNVQYDVTYVAVAVGFFTVFTIVSYGIYTKKDIPAI